MTDDEMFILPPSPFEDERLEIGRGFLEPGPTRQPPEVTAKHVQKPRNSVLTPAQRAYIEQTTSKTNATELAQQYGTTPSYIYTLRWRYRVRMDVSVGKLGKRSYEGRIR